MAFHSGFITIVGRPNVGKSTLMNAFVGEKVAIVSNRPQTTRNRIMGVMTRPVYQIVFLDTPGIHHPRTKLGESMMQSVKDAMDGMDGLLALVDVTQVGEQDRKIVLEMGQRKVPKVLALNKIDLVPKDRLLALIASFSDAGYDAIIPISAKTGDGLAELEAQLAQKLPEGPKYFPDDMMTDQPERQICAELIREGRNYIRHIHACNERIPEEEMSSKLDRLELVITRIFREAEKDPSVAGELKKMMSYYLPTTRKLLDAYCELNDQPIRGQNIESTKKEIEDALDTINTAFENLLDSLFQETAWDISSDISVLHTMLAQEGLTEKDFAQK